TASTSLDTAFLFQEPRLMPWLSVIDNIRLVIPKAERVLYEPRIKPLLEQVGLHQFANAYPKELSGGMARRVALVRAFVRNPALLLMDEPFQALDAPTANQLRQMVLELWHNTRCTVMLVTHSLREALMLADRVVFLSARPSHIVLDYPVNLTRPRTIESTEIHELHQALLTQYPDLLSGSISEVEPC
ncbi:MAG: ABC transporter ATP-binding protein, partial [Thiofilum sp.]